MFPMASSDFCSSGSMSSSRVSSPSLPVDSGPDVSSGATNAAGMQHAALSASELKGSRDHSCMGEEALQSYSDQSYSDQRTVCCSSSDLSCSSWSSLDSFASPACSVESPSPVPTSHHSDAGAPPSLYPTHKRRRECEKEDEQAEELLRDPDSLSSSSTTRRVSHPSCLAGEDTGLAPRLAAAGTCTLHLSSSTSSRFAPPPPSQSSALSACASFSPPCGTSDKGSLPSHPTPAGPEKEQESPSSSSSDSPLVSAPSLPTSPSSDLPLASAYASSSSTSQPTFSSSSSSLATQKASSVPLRSSSSPPVSASPDDEHSAGDQAQPQDEDPAAELSSALPSCPASVPLACQEVSSFCASSLGPLPCNPPRPHAPAFQSSPCSCTASFSASPSSAFPSCCSPPCSSSSSSLSFAQKIIRQVLLRCSSFFASLQLLPCCCPLPLHPLLNPLEVANLPRLLALIELSSGGLCQYTGSKRLNRQGGQAAKPAEHHSPSTPSCDVTALTPARKKSKHAEARGEPQDEKAQRKEGMADSGEVGWTTERQLRRSDDRSGLISTQLKKEKENSPADSRVSQDGEAAAGGQKREAGSSKKSPTDIQEKTKNGSETEGVGVTPGKADTGPAGIGFAEDPGSLLEHGCRHEGTSSVEETASVNGRPGEEELTGASACSPRGARESCMSGQPALGVDCVATETQKQAESVTEKKRLRKETNKEEEKEEKEVSRDELSPPLARRDSCRSSRYSDGRRQEGRDGTEDGGDEAAKSGEDKPLVITNAAELFEDGSGVGRQRTLHWLRRTLRTEMTHPKVEGFLLYLRRPSSSSFHFVACARLEIIEDGDASLSWLVLPKGLSKDSEEELLLSFFVYVICIYLLVMPYKLCPGTDALHPVLAPLMLLQKKELLLEAAHRRKTTLNKTKNLEKKNARGARENEKEEGKEHSQGAGARLSHGQASEKKEGSASHTARLHKRLPEIETGRSKRRRDETEVPEAEKQQEEEDETKKRMTSGGLRLREGARYKLNERGGVCEQRRETRAYSEIPDSLRLPDEIYEAVEADIDALFGSDRCFARTPRRRKDEEAERPLHGREESGERTNLCKQTAARLQVDVSAEAKKTRSEPTSTDTNTNPNFSRERAPSAVPADSSLPSSSSSSSSCTAAAFTSRDAPSVEWSASPPPGTYGSSSASASSSSSVSSASCGTLPQANGSEAAQTEDGDEAPLANATDRPLGESRKNVRVTEGHSSVWEHLEVSEASFHQEEFGGVVCSDHSAMAKTLRASQVLLRALVPLPKEPNLHCRLTVDCGDLLLCPRPLLHLLLDKTPFCRGGSAHKEPDNSEVPKDVRLQQQIAFHLYHLIPLRNPQAYGCKPWQKSRGTRRSLRSRGGRGLAVKKPVSGRGREKGNVPHEEQATKGSSAVSGGASREPQEPQQSEGGKDVRTARTQLAAAISSGSVFHSHVSNAEECCCQVQGAWPLRLFMFHAKELVLRIFPLLLAGSPTGTSATCHFSKSDPSTESQGSSREAATLDVSSHHSPAVSSGPGPAYSTCPPCHASSSFLDPANHNKQHEYSTLRLPFTPSPQLQAELQRILGVKGAGPTMGPAGAPAPPYSCGATAVSGVCTPPPSHLRHTPRAQTESPRSCSSLSRKTSPHCGSLPPSPSVGRIAGEGMTLPAQGSPHNHIQQQLTEKIWSIAKVETFAHPHDALIEASEEQAAHALSAALQKFGTLFQGEGVTTTGIETTDSRTPGSSL